MTRLAERDLLRRAAILSRPTRSPRDVPPRVVGSVSLFLFAVPLHAPLNQLESILLTKSTPGEKKLLVLRLKSPAH